MNMKMRIALAIGVFLFLGARDQVEAQATIAWTCPAGGGCEREMGGTSGKRGDFPSLPACNEWLRAHRTDVGGYEGLPSTSRCTEGTATEGRPNLLGSAIGAAALIAPLGQQLPAMAGVAVIGLIWGALDEWSKEKQQQAVYDRAMAIALREELEAERRRVEEERLRKLAETRNYLLNNLRGVGSTGTISLKTVDSAGDFKLKTVDSAGEFELKTVDTSQETQAARAVYEAGMNALKATRPGSVDRAAEIVADLDAGRAGLELLEEAPELARSPAAENIRKGFLGVLDHDWPAALAWWEQALQLDPTNLALQRSVDLARSVVEWNASMASAASNPQRRTSAARLSTVPHPVLARVEDDSETSAFLIEAKNACSNTSDPNCEFDYASAHKGDFGYLYLSRRNAEHYLLAKNLCEGTAPSPLGMLPAVVQGMIHTPILITTTALYSLAKTNRNAMDSSVAFHWMAAPTDRVLLKVRWIHEIDPSGRSAYTYSPGTLNEVRWSLRGVRDCMGLQSAIPSL